MRVRRNLEGRAKVCKELRTVVAANREWLGRNGALSIVGDTIPACGEHADLTKSRVPTARAASRRVR